MNNTVNSRMLTTAELKEHLIDNRTEHHWKLIESKYTIAFKEATDGIYGCYTIGDSVTFYIDSGNLSKDYFAHELLHAYVSSVGCHIGGCLKNHIRENSVLSALLSLKLLDHIGNVLEHVKTYPIYIELGFDKNKFTVDYLESKLTTADVASLRLLYKSVDYLASDRFVGKLIAALADPNPEFDYSQQLIQLRKFDPHLFDITYKMVERWKLTKFDNVSVLDDDYNTVTWEYYQGLEKWIRKKRNFPLWWHKMMFVIRD
jgi:hypothetical protein